MHNSQHFDIFYPIPDSLVVYLNRVIFKSYTTKKTVKFPTLPTLMQQNNHILVEICLF